MHYRVGLVIAGGWPCQDNSNANQSDSRKTGLSGSRSGLWSEVRRAIQVFRPEYAVMENVPDVLTANHGNDFAEILRDLDEIGYNVEWDCLYGSSFGSPDHRKRLYLVAYPKCLGSQGLFAELRNDAKKKGEKERRTICGANIMVGGDWISESGFPGMDARIPDLSHRIKALGNAVKPPVIYQIFKTINNRRNETFQPLNLSTI